MTQKHSLIHDADLPPVLLQPLVFGNRQQIEALKGLEEKINRETTKKAMLAKGELIYFNVTVEYSGTEHIKVLAIDEADAKEKAKEDVCFDEIEIDHVSATEVTD
jgi:hypothetical protein